MRTVRPWPAPVRFPSSPNGQPRHPQIPAWLSFADMLATQSTWYACPAMRASRMQAIHHMQRQSNGFDAASDTPVVCSHECMVQSGDARVRDGCHDGANPASPSCGGGLYGRKSPTNASKQCQRWMHQRFIRMLVIRDGSHGSARQMPSVPCGFHANILWVHCLRMPSKTNPVHNAFLFVRMNG